MNDYSNKKVPESKLRGWFSLAAIWTASIICIPIFLMAVQMGQNLNVKDILVVSLISGSVYTLIAYLLGPICQATRLPTGQVLKMTFGSNAGNIIAFIVSFNLFAWFAIQLEFFANGLHFAIKDILGINLNNWILILVGGSLMILTSTIGYKALEKLSYITIPIMLSILLWPFIFDHAGNSLQSEFLNKLSLTNSIGSQIAIYIGAFSAGLVISPDLFRYIKNSKHSTFGMAAAFLIAAPLIFVIIAYFSKITGHTDITNIFFTLGLGFPFLILVMLSAWTTNDSNLYTASLGLNSIFPHIKKWKISVFFGILGVFLALIGILSNFMQYLTYLGIMILPITAVLISDFFFNPQNYNQIADKYISNKKLNITALLFGVFIGIGSDILNWWELTTVAPLDGFISTVLYLIIFNYIKGNDKYNLKKNPNIT